MKEKSIFIKNSKILIMGLTFKENCPDLRNSKVIEICNQLSLLKCKVYGYDPNVNKKDISSYSSINYLSRINKDKYDAILIAVRHAIFKNE